MSVSSAAQALCDYAIAQVKNGSIYVLGSQGQTGAQITEPWIRMREHYNASNIKRAIALWKARLAAGHTSLCAYDCSGLIVKWLIDNGYLSGDKNANGLFYDECRQITKAELRAGDLVFRKYVTNSRMYHVGIYIGDGTVVHSKGRDVGVVREKFSSTYWTRYGRLKALLVGESNTENCITRLLKKGKTGDDVELVQDKLLALGYDLGKWGADGDFGSMTYKAVRKFQSDNDLDVDGVVGEQTCKAFGLIWKG
jgi:hypothetical protein